ncbi:MAG TPA: signal recognition particle-docking protein FtsY [Polyangia bacterium]|nr:signal recognition particle-docking protein FtsY [Polyangia bacterium]
MDFSSLPISPTELYELIAVVGGVGVTGALGVLFVRRARAARRRQIDAVDEVPAALPRRQAGPKGKQAEPEKEADREAEPEAAKEEEAAPRRPARALSGHAPAHAPKERAEKPEAETVAAEPEVAPRSAQVIPFPAAPAAKEKAVSALAPGLARTRSSGFIARLGELFSGRKELDASIVDEIEKVLLTADIGVKTSQKLLEEIRSSLTRRELKDPDAVWAFLRRRSAEMLSLPAPDVDFSSAKPFVLLVIGVNGSGKTTTIGKLAAKLAGEGKRVLLAAGDTFRAAAAEQLEIWAGRTGATMVRGKEGADPSSVIFDGVKRAATESFDVAIADTAGRLHTKTDLMQELQKVRRTLGKAAPGAPHETWLVIDSTSGQNAIAQAQIFTEAMAVSGIVLTKLDGTAKGGVILGIADQLRIPVRYVGVGETVDDLRRFDPEEFVEALFAPLEG